jgi:hypothetical protein
MAARFLVDPEQQFGNIGLATAACNAGPARVASWLAGSGDLSRQTQVYVFPLTGRTAEDWAARGWDAIPTDKTVDRRGAFSSPAIFRRRRRWRRSSPLDRAIPVSSAICRQ